MIRITQALPLLCLLLARAATAQNVITTFAGTEWLFTGDGGRALDAPLAGLLGMGVAADDHGNFYVADADNLMVMKVSPDGILHVLAGNGIGGYSGDGGPAVNAAVFLPTGVALDSAENVYIAEYGNRIRKVSPDGTITSIAGTGKTGFSGDGGPATSASFNRPYSVAVDKAGVIYIADRDNHRVRKISGGIVTTIAGDGREGFGGDGGPATAASLDSPYGVAVDANGNVYIADTFNLAIRKVTPAGLISTVAGGGYFGKDGEPATDSLIYPISIAVDAAGNLYIGDLFSNRIAKVNSAGIISTVAGSGVKGYSGDGGLATRAKLNFPGGVAITTDGTLYIADEAVSRVRKVTPDGVISTVAGNGQFRTRGDGGPATSAALYLPTGLAFDAQGNFYTAEPQRNRVRKITRSGVISAFAGTTAAGEFAGDGGPAASAKLSAPYGVAVDSGGSVYITDGLNNRIRRVTPDGIISTFAGNGSLDAAGDGGPAKNASLYDPRYMAFDRAGALYFSEGSHRIRKITPNGIITTVAGNGKKGYSGDGGPAINASLNDPYGVVVDPAGNLYIGDYGNNRVRKVDTSGVIRTVAGNGKSGYSGDGGLAIAASLSNPAGISLDNLGNLYIADESNARLRQVGVDGIISTIAGNGHPQFAGDGGPAQSASLSVPTAVTLDAHGDVYIADWGNSRFRAVLKRPPSFAISASGMNFRVTAAGPVSAAQSVQLAGTIPGLLYTVSAATADGHDWLKVTNDKGSMPASVQISADPSAVVDGSFLGTITITAPDCNPPVRTILVSFLVDPARPAHLTAKTEVLTFTLNQSSAAVTESVTIANDGGAPLPFSASATTTSGGAWLTLSPNSGTATAIAPATLSVTADPTGLSPGAYSGSISIASPSIGESATVRVTMTVSAIRQTIRLAQTGLTFTAVAGAASSPKQSFAIQNSGQGLMNWTVSASTLSGGSNWLSATPASGASAASSPSPPEVEVAVNPGGLAAGQYFGRIQVAAPGADNSPQAVSVVLNVLTAGSDPGPVVEPTGLIFTAVAGGVSPGSQDVLVSNLSAAPVNLGSGRLTADGKNWFVHLPTDATVTPDRSTRIVVQPDLAGLDPGVYRGALTLAFPGGVTRTVNLVFVITFADSAKSARSADAGCVPTKLAPLFTSLPDNFNIVAGWPSPIQVRVVDDCGAAMVSGSVVATFSNGDPQLTLKPSQAGAWSGTWQAQRTANSPLTIAVRAEAPDRKTLGTVAVTGGLRINPSVLPVISPGAVMSSASLSPQTPIAPGSLISILGSGLAAAKLASPGLPAPTDLGGTSVLLAGRSLPLLSVAEDRIDAVTPFDLPVNTQQQLIVQRGNSATLPEPVTVASAEPSVFSNDGTGHGQGRIYKVSDDGTRILAAPGAPAAAGDRILIECTGLGLVDQPAVAGSATAESPSAQTVIPVTVTIGGVSAPVTFAGLVPGSTGLYAIRVAAPRGVATGDAVPVRITVAGQISPPVTMAIQ